MARRNILSFGTLLCIVALTTILAGGNAALADLFTSGDLYLVSRSNPGYAYNTTGGGDMSGASPFTEVGSRSLGQIAWSQDLTTMYSTSSTCDTVFSISASGDVSVYVSGIDATGIVRTLDGRLLTVSYSGRCVYDITDASDPQLVVSGLRQPRNMVQLPTGEILVADYGTIWDISSGSLLEYASLPGSGHSATDIDYTSDGRVFVADQHRIWQIMDGEVSQFAYSGSVLMALAIDRTTDQILAATTGNSILDITGPVSAWAYNMPSSMYIDTALDFVPDCVVPLPGAVLLGALGLGYSGWRLRRWA
jgi:hypothetical protein